MKQVLVRAGEIVVEDVPRPLAEPGSVIVRTSYSCISTGTELSGLQVAETPLWKRVVEDPTKLKRAAAVVATHGIRHARAMASQQLGAATPLGYSTAGVVTELGEGVSDLYVGQRVACAGAGVANHAEIVRVPRNLTVPIPDGVDASHASVVTLGAIALQGVRRCSPTLGETIVVVGLGVLGQMTTQMLKADGCRVIGIDLDPRRVELAEEMGADAVMTPDQLDIDHVARLTDGVGADGVIVTAASSSSDIISSAFQLCRKKGRVVVVGDVGLDLQRADLYAKELDLFISTSYGPGRYDRRYEEEGLDYPVGYVRWTENRNMSEVLRLIAEGRLKIQPLIEGVFDIDDAPAAYESLRSDDPRPLIALLEYPSSEEEVGGTRSLNTRSSTRSSGLQLALIGAGSFAKSMLLPVVDGLKDQVSIHAVVSRTGHNAAETARQLKAKYSSTDPADVLHDGEVDAVMIATRHDTHGSLALAALEAGKHVFVEKPTAMTRDELRLIESFFMDKSGDESLPLLLTGFNRRFSPSMVEVKRTLRSRRSPMIVNFRMNAGYLPYDHWVHGSEGGGRNIGEACHIYDLFTFLTESRKAEVRVSPIEPTGYYSRSDNFVASVSFSDGSVCSLTYTSMGSSRFPKEQMEIFCEGTVVSMDDYVSLNLVGQEDRETRVEGRQAKGHIEEIRAFVAAIRAGGEWPIPLWQQVQAMTIAFDVDDHLQG